MEEKREIPFPQANSFAKIIKIIKIQDEKLLSDVSYLKQLLSLGSARQIDYYLSACEFLGLVTKDRCFTEHGIALRQTDFNLFILKTSQLIVSKPVFGEAFFSEFIFGRQLKKEEMAQLISDLYNITNLAVCERRASTVRNWLDWIYKQKAFSEINEKH